MGFASTAFLYGLALTAAGVCLWQLLPKFPNAWKQLPRERYVGTVIGILCLAWSAQHTGAMLAGGMPGLTRWLPAVVVIGTVLCFVFLDYLMTRALGGALLLLGNHLLHEAFVAHAAARPLFSIVCYVWALAGMLLIAWPFRFRDWLERVGKERGPRLCWSAALGISGLIAMIVALLTGR